MDPLSITASTVAVIGAIKQAANCINRLRAIHQAPLELKLLLEEVADLSELLKHVQTVQNPQAYGEEITSPTKAPGGLDWQISRTSAKLSELNQLLQHHSTRTKRRTPDFGWALGRKKADALRADLKVLRLNLAASLSVNASEIVKRVESTVERVHFGQIKAEQLLNSLIQRLDNCSNIEVSYQNVSLDWRNSDPALQASKASLSTGQSTQESSIMTRNTPGARRTNKIQHNTDPMQIYANKSIIACDALCSCVCHAKRTLRLTQLNVIGSISISYGALPWTATNCDQKSCRNRSVPTLAWRFQFPAWLWKRCLLSSFSYSSIRGPEINVRLPRTVSWSSMWRLGLDGNLAGIQDLFSQGLASPWDVQALGGSLLHYASGSAHWDLCRFLIDQGATLEDEDDFHNSPASLAWEKVLLGVLTEDEASMVASMFRNTDYLQTRQFSVLHKIVLHLIPRTVQSELDFSTRDLNAVDSSGRTCISWAAARGDENALNTLIQYDADLNLPDAQGNTPLHHARNVVCAKILIGAGADITVRNSFQHTPLHKVCRENGSLLLLKGLIDAGIEINAADHHGENALGNAIFNQHMECALHLIQQGADVDNVSSVTLGGDSHVVVAIMRNMPEVLQLLLARGANYTRTDSYHRTILHFAADTASEATIEVLASHGLKDIDIEIRTIDGRTAVDILEERRDDDANPNFKVNFRELLAKIAAAQHRAPPTACNIDPSEQAMQVNRISNLPPLSTLTLLSLDDEDEYDEENEYYEDAPEEVCEMARMVKIMA